MSIADALYPEWENLLVKPDEVSGNLGITGVDGKMLVAAEKYKGRPKSGKIIASGPEAPKAYSPGRRVIFDSHSTTDLGQSGTSEKVLLLNSQQVRLWTDGDEDESDPLGESWRDHVNPPPGCLIVERAAMPTTRGAIWVPDTFNAASRSSEATVVASDDPRFAKGDRVFLAGTTAKHIMLGRRGDVVLWIIRPREISGRLLDDPGLIEPNSHVSEVEMAHLAELADNSFGFEEGDVRAPR